MNQLYASSNPFGIPDSMRERFDVESLPIFKVIKKLGPARVRYVGSPPVKGNAKSIADAPTVWTLDGNRATWRQLFKACGAALPGVIVHDISYYVDLVRFE